MEQTSSGAADAISKPYSSKRVASNMAGTIPRCFLKLHRTFEPMPASCTQSMCKEAGTCKDPNVVVRVNYFDPSFPLPWAGRGVRV